MATRFYGDLYSSASGAKPKDKWRKIFPAGYKSTAKAVSTFLRYPIALSMKPHYTHTVPFTTDDKLIILFGYKEKFVVYKKLNSTVAILENPVFKQSTPPMMFDGAKVGALLHNIEPKLMYAVAKTDFCEQEGIKFCRNDVLLILAECRTIFLGITEDHGVGFFPSETVEVITKPQLCFFEGMMLSVTAVANFKANEGNQLSVQIGQTYDITKGRDSLFDWFASNHRKVPLHAVNGTEGLYHEISEVQPCIPGGSSSERRFFTSSATACHTPPETEEVSTVYDRRISIYGRHMPPLSSTEDGEEDFSDMEHCYFQSYEDYKLPVPIENIKDSPILKKEEEFPPRVKGNLDIYRAPLPPIPPPVYPRPQRPPLPPPLLPPRIPKFQRKSGEYVNQTSTDVYDDVAGSWEHDRLHESCEKEAGSDRNFVELQTEPNSNKHDSSENSDDSSTIDYLELSTDRHQDDEQYTYAAPEEGYDLKKEMDDIRETLKLLLLAQKQITYSKGAEDASEDANIYKRGQTLQKINNMDVSRSLQHTSRKKENHGDDVAKVADQSDEDASEEREETKKLCHTELQASKLSEKKPIDDKNLYGAAGGNEKMTGMNKVDTTQALLEQLYPYRDAITSEAVRAAVAEAVDTQAWHELGRNVKISQNRRTEIDEQKNTIYEKTYDLLGLWYEKFGRNATIGFLLDALVEANPVDLDLILEDIVRIMKESSEGDLYSYEEIPDIYTHYTLPGRKEKNKADEMKVFFNNLVPYLHVEINEEILNMVSQHIDEDEWLPLGKSLEVPVSARKQVEKMHNDDIIEKTHGLLSQWHQRFGSRATLEILLDALTDINVEDLYLILKNLSKEVASALDYEDQQ